MAFERLRTNLLRKGAQSLLQVSIWVQTRAEQENAPVSQEPSFSSNAPAHWLADIDRLKQNPDTFSMTRYVAELEDGLESESSARSPEPSTTAGDSESAHPASKAASTDSPTPSTEGNHQNRPAAPNTWHEEERPTPADFALDEPPTRRGAMPLLIPTDSVPAGKISAGNAASGSTPAVAQRPPALQASSTPQVASPENPEKEHLPPPQDAQSSFQKNAVQAAEKALVLGRRDGPALQQRQHGIRLQKTKLATTQDSEITLAGTAPKEIHSESDVMPQSMDIQQVVQASALAPIRRPEQIETSWQTSQTPVPIEPGMVTQAVQNAPAPQQDFQVRSLSNKWPSLPDEAAKHDSLARFEQRAGIEAARTGLLTELLTERLHNRRRRLNLEQRGKFWNESLF